MEKTTASFCPVYLKPCNAFKEQAAEELHTHQTSRPVETPHSLNPKPKPETPSDRRARRSEKATATVAVSDGVSGSRTMRRMKNLLLGLGFSALAQNLTARSSVWLNHITTTVEKGGEKSLHKKSKVCSLMQGFWNLSVLRSLGLRV